MADPFNKFSNQRSGQERKVIDARRRRDSISVQSSEPEDPRIAKAQKELGLRLAEYRNNNPALNRSTARDMEKLVRDFRDTCKRKGIDLPRMRVVYFVRMNHMCVWPEELEHKELQKRLHLFLVHRQRHGLSVDADDMAMGVRRAYPDYSPSTNLILPNSVTNQQETVQ